MSPAVAAVADAVLIVLDALYCGALTFRNVIRDGDACSGTLHIFGVVEWMPSEAVTCGM